MTILVDMNLSPMWVSFLAQHGIEAVHWSKIGKATAPDSEILDYAAANKSIVFTNEPRFRHSPGETKNSRTKRDSVKSARRASRFRWNSPNSHHRFLSDAVGSGCIISVDLEHQRIRLLPIEQRLGESCRFMGSPVMPYSGR